MTAKALARQRPNLTVLNQEQIFGIFSAVVSKLRHQTTRHFQFFDKNILRCCALKNNET